MRFLIDECLSPDLVQIAIDREFDAAPVVHRRLQGKPDRTIVEYAVSNRHVLVTNDAKDFIPLVGEEAIHCGLVCLNISDGLASRDTQCRLFEIALNELGENEPVNKIIEITLDSDAEVTTNRYDWPTENQKPANNAEAI